MSYISEIFERANLQQICNFLLYGTEAVVISDKSYTERIKEANSKITSIIKEKLSENNDAKEIESVINDILSFSSDSENVYMEIGMQCGAMLCNDLLEFSNNKPL